MTPLFFGDLARLHRHLSDLFFGDPALFGIHHPPPDESGSGKRPAVLVCPSIGHEHTRAQRALRILAEALARGGHHVLRLDYRGLGDSWGRLEDGAGKLYTGRRLDRPVET